MYCALKSVLNGNIFAVYNFSYATLQYVSQCLNGNYDLDFFFLFKQTKHSLFLSKQSSALFENCSSLFIWNNQKRWLRSVWGYYLSGIKYFTPSWSDIIAVLYMLTTNVSYLMIIQSLNVVAFQSDIQNLNLDIYTAS